MSPFEEFAVSACGADARRASEWLETACFQRNVPRAQVERLSLCLHETLVNIVAHGGSAARAAPVRLFLEVGFDSGGGSAEVTVSDAGAAFDPVSAPARTPPKTLGEAASGGLGLMMIRRCADWLAYRHESGLNHFTFGARWSPP